MTTEMENIKSLLDFVDEVLIEHEVLDINELFEDEIIDGDWIIGERVEYNNQVVQHGHYKDDVYTKAGYDVSVGARPNVVIYPQCKDSPVWIDVEVYL